MKEQILEILEKVKKDIASAESLNELEQFRVKYLGKKGELTVLLRGMGKLSKEMRPVIGKLANEVRDSIEKTLEESKAVIKEKEKNARLKNEVIDVTLPGKVNRIGHKHPLTLVLDEIKDIFMGMGYKIAEGPEVETVYYNFDALNAPKDHPSRDLSDTFYINKDILLRTQTSPVQVRVMQKSKPPIRIISPGRCYRTDEIDATHSPMFHQIEGLLIDKDITLGDLKGTLDTFAKRLFGINTKTKFRPHYFPFTEPSGEVDVSCFKCGGKGCKICKGSGWIEILGCGMVHPNVLEECNIDPEVYSGFAFGMGLDRITMLKYEIEDIRLLFENDMRFIEQF
ncbi:phenylalanine--tRNA ligase subunit alpha [Maledivibacter halophilus]|uniref:Phenylalanine--tRNA ligase alpha subunit n=1 Tax=Maledivibacter halophilus TaxID=36842 RepID=A0A1T5IXD0_9FIRM|nr:phenylalanine--tRNA ligase subunit alpha [Maledivibacter halophilus]SKC43593.1 phenylalanyl-tRNA synthetase, alpha subunit [Maledivibacter halophilus]